MDDWRPTVAKNTALNDRRAMRRVTSVSTPRAAMLAPALSVLHAERQKLKKGALLGLLGAKQCSFSGYRTARKDGCAVRQQRSPVSHFGLRNTDGARAQNAVAVATFYPAAPPLGKRKGSVLPEALLTGAARRLMQAKACPKPAATDTTGIQHNKHSAEGHSVKQYKYNRSMIDSSSYQQVS